MKGLGHVIAASLAQTILLAAILLGVSQSPMFADVVGVSRFWAAPILQKLTPIRRPNSTTPLTCTTMRPCAATCFRTAA
jgi:hypothetical protein